MVKIHASGLALYEDAAVVRKYMHTKACLFLVMLMIHQSLLLLNFEKHVQSVSHVAFFLEQARDPACRSFRGMR